MALDAVGSERSSPSYLAALKPDIVKLDQAFIQSLYLSDPAFRLVRSLVACVHDLSIQPGGRRGRQAP